MYVSIILTGYNIVIAECVLKLVCKYDITFIFIVHPIKFILEI